VLVGLGADGTDAATILHAAGVRKVPMRFMPLDEPHLLGLYQRRLVLVRPDGHVAWRDDAAPADPLALIDCIRGAGSAPARPLAASLAVSA
jgi:NAD(P)H-hydrate repair Nnr-like enzyme with NAD(P)H-hydrate epimerase domain